VARECRALLRILLDKHLVQDAPQQGLKSNSLSILYDPTKEAALIQNKTQTPSLPQRERPGSEMKEISGMLFYNTRN
jgi:hypothetical protein